MKFKEWGSFKSMKWHVTSYFPCFNIKIPSWREIKNEIKTERRLLPVVSVFWGSLWTAGDIRHVFTTASLGNEAQTASTEVFFAHMTVFATPLTWLLYSAVFHSHKNSFKQKIYHYRHRVMPLVFFRKKYK